MTKVTAYCYVTEERTVDVDVPLAPDEFGVREVEDAVRALFPFEKVRVDDYEVTDDAA